MRPKSRNTSHLSQMQSPEENEFDETSESMFDDEGSMTTIETENLENSVTDGDQDSNLANMENDDEANEDNESSDSIELSESGGTWVVLPEVINATGFPTFKCQFDSCGQLFATLSIFRDHFVEMHFSGGASATDGGRCGVLGCQFLYNDLDTYRRHLTFHVYQATLQCRGAHVLIKSGQRCKLSLVGANNVYYNGDPLECTWDGCGITFDDVAAFFAHVNEHGRLLEVHDARDGQYVCLWMNCDFSTKRKYEISSHLRRHSGEKLVACPTCGGFFANATKLTDHCARQATSESARLRCVLCSKMFQTERLLRDHGRRHINNYKCPFCELTCPTPSTLRWHVTHRHTEATPYRCMTCSKGFKSAMDLERHFSKHAEGNEHECKVCNRKFKWEQAMKTHERRHYQVDSTPYLCHLCPKKYRVGTFLSQHFNKTHKISVPTGHSRFSYKKWPDGYFRLMLDRLESAQLRETVPTDQPEVDVDGIE